MSSLPPTNAQPPQHKKESWRLRGVTRAAPHLGEGNRFPLIAWLLVGGAVLVLIVVIGFLLLRTGSAVSVATAIPTAATILATPTILPLSTTVAPSTTLHPTSTRTPAPPTATATAIATATATQIKYRVRFGDTLSSIAAKYHVSIQSIMLANRLRTDIIFEGQELIIPVATPHP